MENVEYLGFLIEVSSPKTGTYEYSVFDMTGKDKPEFSVFETDDVEFVSYEAAVCDARSWIRDFLFLDDDRAVEHIEKLYATKKALSSSPSMETTGRVLPKLTAEVFNRPDCPDWAKYAVVNSRGTLMFFGEKPRFEGEDYGCWSCSGYTYKHINGAFFDASDWENSLVERSVLQKLTADVFNRSDCLAWARYAAVNANGKVILFSDKPSVWADDRWLASYSSRVHTLDDVPFDASDWKNSLIERPALPKLTADVFNRSDCPDWANYAVVRADGKVVLFSDEPSPRDDGWVATRYSNSAQATILDDSRFDASGWQNSLIERPVLKKLTVDMFYRPDCPVWAQYAAVDFNERAYWFEIKPQIAGNNRWWDPYGHLDEIPGKFDAGDWQNSLIERPSKLPEWCKVDAIGWHKRCGYFKVTYIDDVSKRIDIQQVEDKSKGYLSFYTVCNETTRARLRPYNTEEMPDVPFGIKDKNSSFRTTVVSCNGDKVWLAGELTAISTEELLRGFTIKGKACGVLEHLNEKGEWVE